MRGWGGLRESGVWVVVFGIVCFSDKCIQIKFDDCMIYCVINCVRYQKLIQLQHVAHHCIQSMVYPFSGQRTDSMND